MKKIAILTIIIILLSVSVQSATDSRAIITPIGQPVSYLNDDFYEGPMIFPPKLQCGDNSITSRTHGNLNTFKKALSDYLDKFTQDYRTQHNKYPAPQEINNAANKGFLSEKTNYDEVCKIAVDKAFLIGKGDCPNNCKIKNPNTGVLNDLDINVFLYLSKLISYRVGYASAPIKSKEEYDFDAPISNLFLRCDVSGKVSCLSEVQPEKSWWKRTWDGLFSSKDVSELNEGEQALANVQKIPGSQIQSLQIPVQACEKAQEGLTGEDVKSLILAYSFEGPFRPQDWTHQIIGSKLKIPEEDELDQQSSDAIIVKSQGQIWPPYNDPDSNWPWNKFIPQSQNPCKEISNEKVVVTSDSVKIGDKEYTPEQVKLTKLTPGFLAANIEPPGEYIGVTFFHATDYSKLGLPNKPLRKTIKSTPDTESNGNGWVEGELAIHENQVHMRPNSGWVDKDLLSKPDSEKGSEGELAYHYFSYSKMSPGTVHDSYPSSSRIPLTKDNENNLAQRSWYGPDYGSEGMIQPPKAQEDQSQQLASVIPGRETIMPPLASWKQGDILQIVIPEGPHTDEPQRLCTKNVEFDTELKDFKPFPQPFRPPRRSASEQEEIAAHDVGISMMVRPGQVPPWWDWARQPGVPPSIPPYPGSPPGNDRLAQKYEEINPRDIIAVKFKSKNPCENGQAIKGIISIPSEEIEWVGINIPGMPRPITTTSSHNIDVSEDSFLIDSDDYAIPPPIKPIITARKDMPGYKPPTGPRRQAVPAQLPPAPKLPEMPTTDTELDDKDCCIKCQPVFQTRIVSINDQCPEGFYKRIFEPCDKHEVKYLQSFCPKKEQTKQISTKNPVPTMPPTVPRPRNDFLGTTQPIEQQSMPCCVSCETNQQADLGQTECNRGNVWVQDCNSPDYRDPAHTRYLCDSQRQSLG